jgi:peptide/nickel transport system substrate-binding protein
MKKAKLLLVVLAFICVFSFALAGGGKEGKEPAYAPGDVPEVKNPDTIIEAIRSNQESLDPYFMYDIMSIEPIKNVYENLLDWDGKSVTEFLPLLSTKVPTMENGLISNDGKTYRFPIRKGVKFHNGNDLTPEDVEYTYERAMVFDRAGGPSWMLLETFTGYSTVESIAEEVSGVPYAEMFDGSGNLLPEYRQAIVDTYEKYIDPAVEVDGDYVVINLTETYTPFLNMLPQGAGWFSILDKEWCIEQGAWDHKAETWWQYHDPKEEEDPLYDIMNGTGPYKLAKWDNGVELVLERNENYWGEKPASKNVRIVTMEEWSTRKAALLAGDVDIAKVDPQYLEQVENEPGIEVYKGLDQLSVYMIFFNQTINTEGGNRYIGSGKLDGEGIPPDFFADVHVRKAFAALYDTQTLIDDVMAGNAMPIYGPIPKPLLGWRPEVPGGHTFDLEEAEKHFRLAFDGELWEKGFKLTAAYTTGRTIAKSALDMLAYNARSINPKFQIETQTFAWNTLLSDYLKGVYPLWELEWNADFPDPHNFVYPILHPNGFYGAALGETYHEWAEENVVPLIDKGIKEFDIDKRRAIYEELVNLSEENAVILFLYQPTRVHVQRDWVEGWYNHPLTGSLGMDFWRLKKRTSD